MKKEFQVSSDLSQVQRVSTKVLVFLKPLNLTEGWIFDIRLCLEEALINAMKYGNNLRKDLKVRLLVEYDDKSIRIQIEDQGKGFNPKKIEDCTKKDNLLRSRGRGVYLIHRLMDKVRYNSKGNTLLMVKCLTKTTRNCIGK